jgi:hypothetical protein
MPCPKTALSSSAKLLPCALFSQLLASLVNTFLGFVRMLNYEKQVEFPVHQLCQYLTNPVCQVLLLLFVKFIDLSHMIFLWSFISFDSQPSFLYSSVCCLCIFGLPDRLSKTATRGLSKFSSAFSLFVTNLIILFHLFSVKYV